MQNRDSIVAMSIIFDIVFQVILDVFVRATGSVILALFGKHDQSRRAEDTVGGVFWLLLFAGIGVAIYLNS